MSIPSSTTETEPMKIEIDPYTFDYSRHFVLPASDDSSWPASSHRFDEESIWALNSAIAAGRPLLLRGEPGIGKSQFARAVARILGVPFLYHVVNERTERDDLLFSYDAVARLGMAQLGEAGVTQKHREAVKDMRKLCCDHTQSSECTEPVLGEILAQSNFICPGVLWWGFDWDDAAQRTLCFQKFCRPCPMHAKPPGWSPTDPTNKIGPVILIDEIDKADPSVPNGLLESLGNEGFSSTMLDKAVRLKSGTKPPLVIITTNEERELPSAFLRRCLVLHMDFPSEANAEDFLIDRARVHIPEADVEKDICKMVIAQLLQDREHARGQGLAKPGAAEFLDILRILQSMHKGDPDAQTTAFKEIQKFAFEKNKHTDP